MKQLAILGGTSLGPTALPRKGAGWPVYGEKEIQAVQEVVKSGMWGTGGPKQVELEEAFAAYCDARYGIMMTYDEELYERLYSTKFCGRGRVAGAGWPTMQSGNFRSNEFAATLGLCQLRHLTEQNLKRRENGMYLEDMLQQEIPGFTHLYRDERVTFQTYYRLSFRYNKDYWDGISRQAVINVVKAEMDGTLKVMPSYDPLSHSPLYQPNSKRTHYLSEEYWKAIDPSRFRLPVIEKMWKEEASNFDHCALLADKSEMDKIVDAFKKVYRNLNELKAYDATLQL